MQTALSAHWPRTSAITPTSQEISAAISGHSEALRATVEALARRAGLRVVTNRAKHDVLLLLIDSSTPIEEGLAQHKVCAIWTEGTPSRSAVTRLLSAGFSGILSIHATAPQLHAALQAIGCGLQVVDPAWMRAEPAQSATSMVATFSEELTTREQQVLTLMAEGLANKEISGRLGISTHTVKFHISSILGKLNAASRTEAVSIGVKSGRLVI
jgi:two-component system, NarL family, response regulator YdfI